MRNFIIMLLITFNLLAHSAIEIKDGKVTPRFKVPDGQFIMFDLEESRTCAKAIEASLQPVKVKTVTKKSNSNLYTIITFVTVGFVTGLTIGYAVGKK